MDKMDKITKESVELARTKKNKKGERETKRICFATTHRFALRRPKEKKPNYKYVAVLRVPFGSGFKRLFPWRLYFNKRDEIHVDSYWCPANTEEEFEYIKKWMENQGERVFLRDCLYTSIALSLNFTDNTQGIKTEIGELEEQAKYHQDMDAVEALAEHCNNTIKDFPLYEKADFVCAVPSQKDYNLPAEIASIVSKQISKNDITERFAFGSEKASAKEAPRDKRWEDWENSELTFDGDLTGKTIILIDDKYQSGATIQYVAMKLQEADASRVLGLCMVKTMKDDDNQ